MGGGDDVVLNAQIIEQKLHRLIVVRFDPADLGRGENDDLRFLFGEKPGDGSLVAEIQFAPVALYQVGEARGLERTGQRAADHSPVAGDEDFIGGLDRHQRISIFLFWRFTQFSPSCNESKCGSRSKRPISCSSAENLSAAKMAGFCRLAEMAALCWPTSAALRKRIFATRSSRHGARFRIGRNKALICADRFYIARPKCSSCAAGNYRTKSRARTATQDRHLQPRPRSRSIGWCITRVGRTSSARFSAR